MEEKSGAIQENIKARAQICGHIKALVVVFAKVVLTFTLMDIFRRFCEAYNFVNGATWMIFVTMFVIGTGSALMGYGKYLVSGYRDNGSETNQ